MGADLGVKMNRRDTLQALGWISASTFVPIATPALAGGLVYHVSGSGSDSNDGMSPASAFRTLQKASNLTLPGDTVLVMNGDYTNPYAATSVLKIERSGTRRGFITYKNYPGHHPRVVVNSNNWQGIAIRASYIVVEGFEVAGNAASTTYEYAYSQKDNLLNPATGANGILADGRNTGTLRNIIIRGNYVHHVPGCGAGAIAADYVTICDNVVHSCAWWNPYGNSGISVYSSRDIDKNTSNYKTIVRRNMCFDNENFIPFHSAHEITDGNGIIIDDNKNTQQSGVAPYKGRTLVENNLCYNNGGTGMHAYKSANTDFLNNTAYFNNRSSNLDNGEIVANGCTSVRLFNNILSAREGKVCQTFWGNVSVVYNHNIYFNGVAGVKGPNDIVADPNFVNASVDPLVADFRSAPGSPALGTATSQLAPSDDIEQTPRPSNLGIDRGAYQKTA